MQLRVKKGAWKPMNNVLVRDKRTQVIHREHNLMRCYVNSLSLF